MRHIVNFGLLFSFLTLLVTGVLSFFWPFSLVVTRIHVVFGTTTAILVGCHLFSRVAYFKQQIASPAKSSVSPALLGGIFVGWAGLLMVSLYNGAPVDVLIGLGYESKHRAAIVRPHPLSASIQNRAEVNVGRKKKGGDTVALSLHGLMQQDGPAPAFAIWAETPAGTMIETLYVSPEMAYSDQPTWHGEQTSRARVLPVWRHRYTMLSGVDPEGKIDATSGATEDHRFSLDEYLSVDGGEYLLFFEINAPFDVTDTWSDPHIGQPSVLYSARVTPSVGSAYVIFELTGHSGSGAPAGVIYYDLDSVTTAKKLVDVVIAKSVPLAVVESP